MQLALSESLSSSGVAARGGPLVKQFVRIKHCVCTASQKNAGVYFNYEPSPDQQGKLKGKEDDSEFAWVHRARESVEQKDRTSGEGRGYKKKRRGGKSSPGGVEQRKGRPEGKAGSRTRPASPALNTGRREDGTRAQSTPSSSSPSSSSSSSSSPPSMETQKGELPASPRRVGNRDGDVGQPRSGVNPVGISSESSRTARASASPSTSGRNESNSSRVREVKAQKQRLLQKLKGTGSATKGTSASVGTPEYSGPSIVGGLALGAAGAAMAAGQVVEAPRRSAQPDPRESREDITSSSSPSSSISAGKADLVVEAAEKVPSDFLEDEADDLLGDRLDDLPVNDDSLQAMELWAEQLTNARMELEDHLKAQAASHNGNGAAPAGTSSPALEVELLQDDEEDEVLDEEEIDDAEIAALLEEAEEEDGLAELLNISSQIKDLKSLMSEVDQQGPLTVTAATQEEIYNSYLKADPELAELLKDDDDGEDLVQLMRELRLSLMEDEDEEEDELGQGTGREALVGTRAQGGAGEQKSGSDAESLLLEDLDADEEDELDMEELIASIEEDPLLTEEEKIRARLSLQGMFNAEEEELPKGLGPEAPFDPTLQGLTTTGAARGSGEVSLMAKPKLKR